MERILKLLQSNKAVLIAAIMSLTTQLWHSVKAFVILDVGGTENLWNFLFGILFSLSTSLAILLFTVRGRKNLAYFFLAVEVFINIIHYSVMGMTPGPILLSTLFMCIIVPVTIAVYSSEINLDEDLSQDENLSQNEIIPEVEAIPTKLPVPKIDREKFLQEINDTIGFDITKPRDASQIVSEEEKANLKALWKQRNNFSDEEIMKQISTILEESAPLFK